MLIINYLIVSVKIAILFMLFSFLSFRKNSIDLCNSNKPERKQLKRKAYEYHD